MASRYDLVVIGGGTAGLVSTAGAASLGTKVALVERDKLGGDCLHRGRVPTKTLVKSARVAHLINHSEEYGIKISGYEVDFSAVMDRMVQVIQTAGEQDEPDRFRELGVDVFLDEARFTAPDEVAVDSRRLTARSVIVATGFHSTTPPIEGIQEVGYLTHVEALKLRWLPRSVIAVGSGPIGCEFAQIFSRFGSEVTMIDTVPLPLPQEDPEVGEILRDVLMADGVTFRSGYRAEEARSEGGEKILVARNEQGEKMENAGIDLEKKGLKVDINLRTTAENVYAAGDITGKYPFTHVAEYQGRIALRNALSPSRPRPITELSPGRPSATQR
ncbi:MAG: FAD-dependent oxidoreductase [Actinobacteria bacterium]|nr:FAD-dependent oxidoreductase [Actinomycetota bacterium]